MRRLFLTKVAPEYGSNELAAGGAGSGDESFARNRPTQWDGQPLDATGEEIMNQLTNYLPCRPGVPGVPGVLGQTVTATAATTLLESILLLPFQ